MAIEMIPNEVMEENRRKAEIAVSSGSVKTLLDSF
jgi:hypothetical protein